MSPRKTWIYRDKGLMPWLVCVDSPYPFGYVDCTFTRWGARRKAARLARSQPKPTLVEASR